MDFFHSFPHVIPNPQSVLIHIMWISGKYNKMLILSNFLSFKYVNKFVDKKKISTVVHIFSLLINLSTFYPQNERCGYCGKLSENLYFKAFFTTYTVDNFFQIKFLIDFLWKVVYCLGALPIF